MGAGTINRLEYRSDNVLCQNVAGGIFGVHVIAKRSNSSFKKYVCVNGRLRLMAKLIENENLGEK